MSARARRAAGLVMTLTAAACAHAGAAGGANGMNGTSGGAADAVTRAVRDSVAAVMARAIADSAFPGAYAMVGTHDRVLAVQGAGVLDWATPGSPRPDEHTLWDMASLTKVIGMTTAMMQLTARGKVDLDAPVQRYIPEWTGTNKERVRVRDLLTHSSGLVAWRSIYKEATSPEHAVAIVLATPLDTVPGARMVYSDLGAIILGKIVERVSGQPLDAYLRDHVFAPLGMTETMYRPPASLLPRIAPTEYDPWRQRKLRGEVHDENAYALGGVSGHAGLFSSAHDLGIFAQMLLGRGTYRGREIVPAGAVATFTVVQDRALSNRALGWEVPGNGNSAGSRLSPSAFGHTGFTGTSIWMDPARDLFIILLTNRVNPTRENRKIGGVRVALADAVAAAVDAARATRPATPTGPRQ